MMFGFFFFCGFDGDGGCCGYGLVVRCLIFFFLWVWWLGWWIGDYNGDLVFYFVCGFGCVCVGGSGSGSGGCGCGCGCG